MNEVGGGRLVKQDIGGEAVGNLPAGEQEGDGATVSVHQGIDFGGTATTRM